MSVKDELSESFTRGVKDGGQSSYRELYKKRSVLSQEERRRRTLESQKRRRNQLFDLNRDFGYNDDDDTESLVEEMETSKNEEKKKRKGGISKLFMFSEWLLEVPVDLSEKWYFVPSPVGRRCVVIANKGFTKMFTKWGKFMKKFQSGLPCGFKGEYRFGPTILDCIWCEQNSTCYVLDVIVWKGQTLNDCEAEFRFYWLKTKFEETPELQGISSKNQCHLEVLPSSLYNPTDLANIVGIGSVWAAGNPSLDGILFYHRNAHYHSGEVTPLVGWLKPFMLPEVLGIEVPDSLLCERPDNYVSMEQYVQEFAAKKKNCKLKRYNMEVDETNHDSVDNSCEIESDNVGLEDVESMAYAERLEDCEH